MYPRWTSSVVYVPLPCWCFICLLFCFVFSLFVLMSASIPVYLFAWRVPLTRCPHYTLSIHNSSPCSHPPRHHRSIRLQAVQLCSHRSERYSNPTTLTPLPISHTHPCLWIFLIPTSPMLSFFRIWSLLPFVTCLCWPVFCPASILFFASVFSCSLKLYVDMLS